MRRWIFAVLATIATGSLAFGIFSSFPDAPASESTAAYLVVVDAPKGFADRAGRMGYAVVDTIDLADLAMVAYRVRVPAGETVRSSSEALQAAFPDIVIDLDDLGELEPAAPAPGPVKYPTR